MSRRHVQNPEQFGQLPMFVQAKTLRNDYIANDATTNGWDKDDLYDLKAGEAHSGTRLYQSIKEGGIQKPINVWHEVTGRDRNSFSPRPIGKTVLNGHHRVAVQNELNPEAEVPVNHAYRVMEGESSFHDDSERWTSRAD